MNVEPSRFSGAERAFRQAIRRHEFTEPAVRILDAVLHYGLGRGEFKALIPKRNMFCALCGLTKGKVSETIDLLERARVLEVEDLDRGRGRPWCMFGLRPPEEWRVPFRLKESDTLKDLESWLERVSVDQPDLLPPPASLDAMLVEEFVERSARGQVAGAPVVSSRAAAPPAHRESSLAGNLVVVPTKVPRIGAGVEEKVAAEVREANQVPSRGTLSSPGEGESSPTGNLVGRKVPPQGTSSGFPIYTGAGARRSIDRIIESKCTDPDLDRVVESIEGKREFNGGLEHRQYVADRLFKLIGLHERNGPMGATWRQAVDQVPDQVNELVAHVEMRQRCGENISPVRWLNVAVRKAMEMRTVS
jgi:hypothetical protein